MRQMPQLIKEEEQNAREFQEMYIEAKKKALGDCLGLRLCVKIW